MHCTYRVGQCAANSSLSEVKRVEERGKVEEKNGEAKPRPNNVESGVSSGRLLEDLSQVGSTMVRALPAMSAIRGLWGIRCGWWPTLAVLTCAV